MTTKTFQLNGQKYRVELSEGALHLNYYCYDAQGNWVASGGTDDAKRAMKMCKQAAIKAQTKGGSHA